MNISINAKVNCRNQECGESTCVIINPINKEVTHIVVREKGFIGIERLVSVEEIAEATKDSITLRCSQSELSNFQSFNEEHYIAGSMPFLNFGPESYYMHPYLVAEFDGEMPFLSASSGIEHILPGELGIHRGSIVQATNGKIGMVDEFLISPVDNHISHLVLREGHLWGQKLVTIPVSKIDRIETDTVYLKLDKQAVESLPTVPVKRSSL